MKITKSLLKNIVRTKTGRNCEIQTFWCCNKPTYIEGQTLEEFKRELKSEHISYSSLNYIYRLVEIWLLDENGDYAQNNRWDWCAGDTLDEAYEKLYNNLIK